MREIEYRAWDMLGIFNDNKPCMILDIINHSCCCEILRNSNFIKLQYTGLKDKNDKKIYKDDKVRDRYGRIYLVYWHDGEKGDLCTGWHLLDKNKELWIMNQRGIRYLQHEVIGNIHENPELKDVI